MMDPIFTDPTLNWAIDMDGTLIREDVTDIALTRSMRSPTLWHIFIFSLLLWIFRTAAHSQRFLEFHIRSDPKTLTFNNPLIEAIDGHRKRGGHVILATASHVRAAEPIAKHVDIFDDVLGSNPAEGCLDARAKEKARLLDQRYPNGFLYAGNSKDDLEVWDHPGCKAMLLVNCNPQVLKQARSIRKPYIVIP